ncbi:MAG TPA: MFS transporter, partial [Gaiellales bacterium]|nr:MFS transporter [Gaiellales bacterium]
ALCTMANWLFNFIVSFTFLSAVSALGKDGVFWLYAAIGVVAVIFFWRAVPETAHRSLEEIQEDVTGRSRRRHRTSGRQAHA